MSPLSKSISVVFLTGLMLVKTLMVPVLLLDFTLRQHYIATYLCENRQQPDLHCNGTCYLAKKLKATRDSHDRQALQHILGQASDVAAQLPSLEFAFSPGIFLTYTKPALVYLLCIFPKVDPARFFQPPQLP